MREQNLLRPAFFKRPNCRHREGEKRLNREKEKERDEQREAGGGEGVG